MANYTSYRKYISESKLFYSPYKSKKYLLFEDLQYLYKRQNKEPGLKIYWQLYMPYMKLDKIWSLEGYTAEM